MTEGQGTAADRGRPSFFAVGVEVASERDSAVWIRPRWASSRNGRQWPVGVPGKAFQGFSELVPNLLFRLAPTFLCPVRKQTRVTLLYRSPANMTSCWYVSTQTR